MRKLNVYLRMTVGEILFRLQSKKKRTQRVWDVILSKLAPKNDYQSRPWRKYSRAAKFSESNKKREKIY